MKQLIAALATILLSLPTLAQIRFSNLDEVLSYADKHSSVIRSGQLQEEIKNLDERLYRSSLLPRVEFTGTADYYPVIPSLVIPEEAFGGQEGRFKAVKFGLPFTTSTGLDFSMPLVNAEKWTQLKSVLLEKEKAKFQVKTEQEALHIQLGYSYYNALLGKEMVKFSGESRQAVNQLLATLTERKNQGLLDPADYNRAKALAADVAGQAISYYLFLAKARASLHQLLGIPLSDSIELSEKACSDWTSALLSPERERPALLAARTEVKIAQQAVLQNEKASLPKLNFHARYAYQWQMQKDQSVQFDLGTVGLNLGIPLFTGNYYNASRKKSKLLLETVKLKEQQTQLDMQKEQADWLSHYTAASEKNEILQKKVAANSDNLRIAHLALKEGVMEFEEYHRIFQEWTSAQTEYLQNLNEGLFYHFLLTQKL